MDVATIITALTALYNAIKPLLPLLAPIIVAGIKKILPGILEKANPLVKPIISMVVGMLIAYLTGLNPDASAVESLAIAGGLGLGASKGRDIIMGKNFVSDKPQTDGGNC